MNANGPNRRPSCPSVVKIGINDNVIISRLINSAGPTSTDASVITCQRVLLSSVASGCWCCLLFQPFMCIFDHDDSGIDHRPDGNRNAAQRHNIGIQSPEVHDNKAIHNPSGNEIIATSAERTCQRNSAQTTATTINSSSNLPLRLSMARSMSWLRSYVVTISTPSGRLLSAFPVCPSRRRSLLGRFAGSQDHHPPATSPSPFSSAMPPAHLRANLDLRNIAQINGHAIFTGF